jgi:YD repeat-containing protein
MEEDLERRNAAANPQNDAVLASFLDDVNQTRGQQSPGDTRVAMTSTGTDLYQWAPNSHLGNDVPITDRRQNPDGSLMEFGMAADGRQHPIRIVYPDGRSTQYGYDRNGRVNEVANRDAQGVVVDHWMDQGGNRFVETRTGAVMEGTISVRQDGTAVFQGRGGTIENRTDGSLVTRFQEQDGRPHMLLTRGDGSTVEYVRMDNGRDSITRVRFPNGNETTYDYDRNGRIYQTNDWGPGGPAGGNLLLSFSTRDGQTWQENQGRAPDQIGDLQLTEEGLHVFRNMQDGTTFVRRPDGQITVQDRNGQVVWSQPGTATPRQRRR